MFGSRPDQLQNDVTRPSPNGPAESGAPRQIGPLSYLRDAIRIARFDGDAIARISRDPKALIYGAGVLAASGLLVYWLTGPPAVSASDEPGLPGWLAAIGMTATALASLALSALNVAVMHGAAKLLFGASGAYVGVLRVLWLGSIVQFLSLIPVIGGLVAGLWTLLITLVAFEEVEGIERLQALVLVVGLAAVAYLVSATVA